MVLSGSKYMCVGLAVPGKIGTFRCVSISLTGIALSARFSSHLRMAI